MPGLQGNPGIPGDSDAPVPYWLQREVDEAQEIFLPDESVGARRGWDPAQVVELVESDSAMADLSGTFGRTGSAFLLRRRIAEPRRLSGPVQFVVKLLEIWRLEEEDAVRLLGFDRKDADHVAAVLAGREEFRGQDVRERIAHLLWIRKTLFALFRDRDTENAWLRGSHSWLDGRVPMELMLGGSMEDLLLVRDYVDTAAGV